ncbi:MAG: hypothetical protein FD152_2886 [Xanthobacteraceae bacterium]|nr:MAG: hypothetical protein FD152_2886 [Xanthobacteraceae bacterium]
MALFFWYLPRFTEAAIGVATLSATTAMAASVTIAHRMVLMSDPSTLLHRPARAEAMRMIGEKVDAAAQGSLDAAFEVGRLAIRSASGRMSTDDVAHGLLAIGVAATRPAARRAKANARRLSRG